MKLGNYLQWAGLGWLAGVGTMLAIGYLVLPAVISSRPASNPAALVMLGGVLLLVTPFALLGGILGGRLQREGDASSQRVMAALLGVFATIPCACTGFWFSGW